MGDGVTTGADFSACDAFGDSDGFAAPAVGFSDGVAAFGCSDGLAFGCSDELAFGCSDGLAFGCSDGVDFAEGVGFSDGVGFGEVGCTSGVGFSDGLALAAGGGTASIPPGKVAMRGLGLPCRGWGLAFAAGVAALGAASPIATVRLAESFPV